MSSEDPLWALTFVEAHERGDAEGVAAMLLDVPVEVAAARLAGMTTAVVVHLCIAIGVSPGEWAAQMRSTLTGMEPA